MTKLNVVNLENLSGGIAVELFEHCLSQVLADIDNVNTQPLAARKISLEFTFKPMEKREAASITVASKVKLAGVKSHTSMVYLSQQGSKLVALGSDPSQMEIPMEQPTVIQGGKNAR